jgi:ABC-type transport system involved in multi-copper enzyme maturation permease subunit
MRNLVWIAVASFRETVRDKILYTLLFFIFLMFGFSMLLGSWSIFAYEKVIKDFSLGAMSIGALLMAIFIGVGLIQKEIQRTTVYALVAKPVARWQFLVGKYLGLVMVLCVNLLAMMAGLYLILILSKCSLDPRLWWAALGAFWEMAVITAAALLFSSFSTPIVSSLFTLGLYVAGHLSGDLVGYMDTMARNAKRIPGATPAPPWLAPLAKAVQKLIPDLELFNVRGLVVHGLPLPEHWALAASLHGLGWCVIYLAIASAWFSRRDFV